MGDHEDEMFIYKGADGTHVNGGSPPRGESTHRGLPPLGPMVLDRSQLATSKWTRIRALLSENCLHTYPIQTQPGGRQVASNSVAFELPVHLPGYYILVNKTDVLGTHTQSPSPSSLLLYVFKLVTYHHLYLFAVDSPNKLAQWIVRFGYRFCCNPNDSHLCFTYYLSTVHVDPISKSTTGQQRAAVAKTTKSEQITGRTRLFRSSLTNFLLLSSRTSRKTALLLLDQRHWALIRV